MDGPTMLRCASCGDVLASRVIGPSNPIITRSLCRTCAHPFYERTYLGGLGDAQAA